MFGARSVGVGEGWRWRGGVGLGIIERSVRRRGRGNTRDEEEEKVQYEPSSPMLSSYVTTLCVSVCVCVYVWERGCVGGWVEWVGGLVYLQG